MLELPRGQLEEVCFCNSILFIEDIKNIELNLFALRVVVKWSANAAEYSSLRL